MDEKHVGYPFITGPLSAVRSVFMHTLALASGVMLLLATASIASPSQPAGFIVVDLALTYGNRGSAAYSLRDLDRAFYLFPNTSYQHSTILSVETNLDGQAGRPAVYRLASDEDGNPQLILQNLSVAPGATIRIRVSSNITLWERQRPSVEEARSGRLSDIPQEIREGFAKAEGLWRVNASQELDLAVAAAFLSSRYSPDGNALTALLDVVDWVGRVAGLRYGEAALPRSRAESLRARVAGAADYAALVVTLCRAVGIPAFVQTGVVFTPSLTWSLSERAVGYILETRDAALHAWAVAYVPPWGWLPVDMVYGYQPSNPSSAISEAAWYSSAVAVMASFSKVDYASLQRQWFQALGRSAVAARLEYGVAEARFPTPQSYGDIQAGALLGVAAVGVGVSMLYLDCVGSLRRRRSA